MSKNGVLPSDFFLLAGDYGPAVALWPMLLSGQLILRSRFPMRAQVKHRHLYTWSGVLLESCGRSCISFIQLVPCVPLARLCKNDDQPIEEYLLSPCDLLALISKTYVENGTSQEGSVIYILIESSYSSMRWRSQVNQAKPSTTQLCLDDHQRLMPKCCIVIHILA